MTLETNNLPHDPSETAPQRAVRPSFFYLIALIVFVSDQISKAWIQQTLGWEQTQSIIPNVFSLTLTRNTGGAWGLLPNGNLLFIAFATVAVFALIFAYHRMPQVPLLVGAALSLALGGALGNLLDRLRYSYVVDFFYVHYGRFHWPIFNVADSGITLGICLLLLHFLRTAKDSPQEAVGATSRRMTSVLPAEESGSQQSEI